MKTTLKVHYLKTKLSLDFLCIGTNPFNHVPKIKSKVVVVMPFNLFLN